MESTCAIFTAGIQQNACADDVGLQEYAGVFNRSVYMAFRCKIYDDIRLLLLKERVNRIPIGNAALHKRELRIL